jgi:hypothetical protein
MIEKLLHRGDRLCRVFFLGGMSKILEKHKPAPSNMMVAASIWPCVVSTPLSSQPVTAVDVRTSTPIRAKARAA